MSKRLNYKNKALLKIGGITIIERIIKVLSKGTKNILIIANQTEEYENLGIPTYNDIFPGSGPLGGIYTGLKISKTNYNLLLACDMPFIQPHLLTFLINQCKGYDITIPVTPDGYHPLCAVYSKECISPIELLIDSKNLKITNLFSYVKVNKIDFAKLSHEFDPKMFYNINTEEDYLNALSTLANE